jgi:uncharacterized RDD family membrane protein YckC
MTAGGQYNPYQPPVFDQGALPQPTASGVLASRVERLGAAIFDGMLSGVVLIPLQIALGVYDGVLHGRPQGALAELGWSLGAFVLYLGLHGYLLATAGQTIGKRVVKIRIVNFAGGGTTPFSKILLSRLLPVQALALIPKVGLLVPLIDILLIFGKDLRCLHDRLAGTMVVKVTR